MAASDSMTIEVRTLTGRKVSFDVESTTTVAELKAELQEKEGIHSSQIRLLHSGEKLNNSETLGSHGIKAGSTINMVLSMRAGN